MPAARRPIQDVRWLRVGVLAIPLLLVSARPIPAAGSRLPGSESKLVLTAPINKWDKAVPLGNGLLGGLLWGEGQTIRVSLDRGDFWDLRTPAAIHEKGFTYANLQKFVHEQNVGEISRLADAPYNHCTRHEAPRRPPGDHPRPARTVTSFELDLARAEGRARLSDSTHVLAFFSAVQPVALIRFSKETTMPFINADDLNVYYIENGTQGGLGTIVFVHGNWATNSWWEPVLASPLTKPWRGIAYDVRGRGRTTGPDSDYSIPSLAADLGSFIEALGIATPHLVGHSLGSAIVMQFALDHPATVRSLTVAAPAWVDGMPNPPGTVERQRKLKDDGAAFYEAMSWLCPTMPMGRFWIRLLIEGHEQRWEAARANVEALANWGPGKRLGDIPCPKLVIGGEKDPLVNAVIVEKAAAALGALRVVMPGVDHGLIIEQPETFTTYFAEFIRTIDYPKSSEANTGRVGERG